ncbi:hypothetical protein GCM10009551_097590 [Nocardiopsis tropica]|uniref:hypothetical protein n=1 Tax=Tsukamurella strandjordii TaxID=147577 RepID=UPI0031D1651E
MTDRQWTRLGAVLGAVAAVAGTAAVVLFATTFANPKELLAVAGFGALGSWFARRRGAHGKPAPLVAYDLGLMVAVVTVCGTLAWSISPAEPGGWPLVFVLVAPVLLLIWVIRTAATWRRVPIGLTVAVPLIVAITIGLTATSALTDARYALAKNDFQAIALNPPPRGEGRDMRIGTYWARVFTRDDGAVKFRFGNSWTGLMYVPEGLPDPSPDDPQGYYRPWAPRWWTFDAD